MPDVEIPSEFGSGSTCYPTVEIPSEFGSGSTCYRRFVEWRQAGVFHMI